MRLLLKGLVVTPIPGETYRYEVESSKPGEPHLVDLEARFPLGRCSCRNYECVRWPSFKKTFLADPCKHLDAALRFHALRHIRNTSLQLKNNQGE